MPPFFQHAPWCGSKGYRDIFGNHEKHIAAPGCAGKRQKHPPDYPLCTITICLPCFVVKVLSTRVAAMHKVSAFR
jgi:hypothetical protein